MPRIAWIEEANAQGQLAEIYDAARSEHGFVPDIHKTMSHRRLLSGDRGRWAPALYLPPDYRTLPQSTGLPATH